MLDKIKATLKAIIDQAPSEEPDAEDYHDTESAFSQGVEVGHWESAQDLKPILKQLEDGPAGEPVGEANHLSWEDAVEQQGWDGRSQVSILQDFIQAFGLKSHLDQYASRRAQEENEGALGM